MTTASRSDRPSGDTLGARVRAARMAKHVSLRKLAATLNVSPATLSQIENGRTGLSTARLNLIADALGVSVTQILDTVVAAPPARGGADTEPTPKRPGPPVSPETTADWRRYEPLDFDPVLRAALDE